MTKPFTSCTDCTDKGTDCSTSERFCELASVSTCIKNYHSSGPCNLETKTLVRMQNIQMRKFSYRYMGPRSTVIFDDTLAVVTRINAATLNATDVTDISSAPRTTAIDVDELILNRFTSKRSANWFNVIQSANLKTVVAPQLTLNLVQSVKHVSLNNLNLTLFVDASANMDLFKATRVNAETAKPLIINTNVLNLTTFTSQTKLELGLSRPNSFAALKDVTAPELSFSVTSDTKNITLKGMSLGLDTGSSINKWNPLTKAPSEIVIFDGIKFEGTDITLFNMDITNPLKVCMAGSFKQTEKTKKKIRFNKGSTEGLQVIIVPDPGVDKRSITDMFELRALHVKYSNHVNSSCYHIHKQPPISGNKLSACAIGVIVAVVAFLLIVTGIILAWIALRKRKAKEVIVRVPGSRDQNFETPPVKEMKEIDRLPSSGMTNVQWYGDDKAFPQHECASIATQNQQQGKDAHSNLIRVNEGTLFPLQPLSPSANEESHRTKDKMDEPYFETPLSSPLDDL